MLAVSDSVLNSIVAFCTFGTLWRARCYPMPQTPPNAQKAVIIPALKAACATLPPAWLAPNQSSGTRLQSG